MNPKIKFVALATLITVIIYAFAGVIFAFIMNSGEQHPHSMAEIFYIILPLTFSGIGLLIGLVSSLILTKKEEVMMAKINKMLVIGAIFLLLLSIANIYFWGLY
jgi:hypothetical protein